VEAGGSQVWGQPQNPVSGKRNLKIKIYLKGQMPWLTLVIPTSWQVEIGRIAI
jgi:hypothetical protein